jgi:hypothetical protein
MRHPHGLRAAVGNQGIELPAIGAAFEGGFYAGLISHTANSVPTHALIVAPANGGATGGGGQAEAYPLGEFLTYKVANTFTPGADNTFDGEVNMAAILASSMRNHPAANFCFGLTLNGYSDWYLPARYELDIAFENLKRDITNNNEASGINPYSVPERTVNRTLTGPPLQTTALNFRTGGGEEFLGPGFFHWTSTSDSTLEDKAFGVDMNGGRNLGLGKDSGAYTRAFRKVVL